LNFQAVKPVIIIERIIIERYATEINLHGRPSIVPCMQLQRPGKMKS